MGGRGKISFRRFAGKIKGWSTVLLYLWMFLLSVLLILISVMGVTRNAGIPSTKPGSIPALANSVALTDKPKLFYLHYIRFKPVNSTGVPLRFTEYLSVLSGVQRLKPDVILIHGDEEPTGDYWKTLKDQNIVRYSPIKKTSQTGFWSGGPKSIPFPEHSADIAKLDALLQFGGVVVDFDVYFVRGEKIKRILKQGKIITCYGNKEGYNMGLVAAEATSQVLWAWRRSYTDIYVADWNFNSGFVPKFLSYLYPNDTYILNGTCNNPHPFNLAPFFNDNNVFHWRDSVAIHTYSRVGGVAINSPEDLRTGNLTSYKDLLITILENKELPPENQSQNDELRINRDFEP